MESESCNIYYKGRYKWSYFFLIHIYVLEIRARNTFNLKTWRKNTGSIRNRNHSMNNLAAQGRELSLECNTHHY